MRRKSEFRRYLVSKSWQRSNTSYCRKMARRRSLKSAIRNPSGSRSGGAPGATRAQHEHVRCPAEERPIGDVAVDSLPAAQERGSLPGRQSLDPVDRPEVDAVDLHGL